MGGTSHEKWMRVAIEEARAGIAQGQTPFGAAIVRVDELVARGHNEVWTSTDPTAHAEVVVIRRAAVVLRSIDLTGCTMYTTCEPCPMCAAAIHWCKLDAVCYGAAIADAKVAGFNELTVPIGELYRLGVSPVRVVPPVMQRECAALFREWLEQPAHRAY
jgi:tRNA(Arg) A34 adenosine deaminase TadA